MGCFCRELFQLGVRCFDIDVVTTADRQLLITHPTAIQVYLKYHCSKTGKSCSAGCICFMTCLPQHYILQDVLRESVDNNTDRGGAAVHLHSLKAVRQLGGNSSSFPSAAEVRNPDKITTCFASSCKLVVAFSHSLLRHGLPFG